MDELTIRGARLEDLDEVAALERSVFPSPWKREFFEGEFRSAGRLCIVAVNRTETLAGYVFAMQVFDEMHINKIAVCPDLQRHGLATKLMEYCLGWARSHEIVLITLEVRESNHAAQEFYRSLQFQPSYTRPRYYPNGEAALVMSLRV